MAEECKACRGKGHVAGYTDAGGAMRAVLENCDTCGGRGWIEPDYDAEMALPAGKTCGDCAYCDRCCAMFGHKPTDTKCDFWPSRYREANRPASAQAPSGSEGEGQ